MENCIFCKLANGEITAQFLYEDSKYVAFRDIHPKTPNHILIIPKKHLENFHLTTNFDDQSLIKGLFDVAWKLIDEMKLNGCQLHINSGSDHGQEIQHIHLHLLNNGVSDLKW